MEKELTGFEARTEEFNKEFQTLQERYAVKIYAANCVLKNGEVIPLIRVVDDLKLEIVKDSKKYDDKAKAGNPVGKKA